MRSMALGTKAQRNGACYVSICQCHLILKSHLSIYVEVEIDRFDVCTHLVFVTGLITSPMI